MKTLMILTAIGILSCRQTPIEMLGDTTQNQLKDQSPESWLEEAELDLEGKRYSDAETKLLKYLEQKPTDYYGRALLAAALAAQSGIILLNFITDFLAAQSGGGGGNSFSILEQVLPSPTSSNLNYMGGALSEMGKIPGGSKTSEMSLQHELYASLYSMMQVQKAKQDIKDTGTLTPETARAVLENLDNAEELLADSGSDMPLDEAISEFQEQIDAEEGDTEEERLENLLNKLNQGEG